VCFGKGGGGLGMEEVDPGTHQDELVIASEQRGDPVDHARRVNLLLYVWCVCVYVYACM
jgi:hypothetical protein